MRSEAHLTPEESNSCFFVSSRYSRLRSTAAEGMTAHGRNTPRRAWAIAGRGSSCRASSLCRFDRGKQAFPVQQFALSLTQAESCKEIRSPLQGQTDGLQKSVPFHGRVVPGEQNLSRTDLILDENGTPWFIDVNVVPGMTETSLLPLSLMPTKFLHYSMNFGVFQKISLRS